MRRYVSNKGLDICFQADDTAVLVGPDASLVNQVRRPLIRLTFSPLLGGVYATTPWDMATAYQAFGRVVGSGFTYAEAGDRVGKLLETPEVVHIHGFRQGQMMQGLVRPDGTTAGEEAPIDPSYRIWVFDVDAFCRTNPHAKDREQEIEDFLEAQMQLHPGSFVRVEQPEVALPSPNYLSLVGRGSETTTQKLAKAVEQGFLDPERVIAYEQRNPRNHSEEIVAEMERLIVAAQPAPEPDAELVSA